MDRELPLDEVTPEMLHALSLLEPFGMDNPEPVFTARAVRLMAPPQMVKDKHVRLRVAPAVNGAPAEDYTPRCHPDAAAISRRVGTGLSPVQAGPSSASTSSTSWRRNVTFKAMGWGLKETCDQLKLLPADRVDIAYTLGMNDHPEFGGLELTVRDLVHSAEHGGNQRVMPHKIVLDERF